MTDSHSSSSYVRPAIESPPPPAKPATVEEEEKKKQDKRNRTATHTEDGDVAYQVMQGDRITVGQLREVMPDLVVVKIKVRLYREKTGREQDNEDLCCDLEMSDDGEHVIRYVPMNVAFPSGDLWEHVQCSSGGGAGNVTGGLLQFGEELSALAVHIGGLRSAYVQEHQKRPKKNKNGDLPAAYGSNPGGTEECDFDEHEEVKEPSPSLSIAAVLVPQSSLVLTDEQLPEKDRARYNTAVENLAGEERRFWNTSQERPCICMRAGFAKAVSKIADPNSCEALVLAGIPTALPTLLTIVH